MPDTYDDGTHGEKAVTEIGSFACSPNSVGHKNLVSLRLPASLIPIGNNAFRNCTGFSGSLTLPASLTSIGSSVFYQCSLLATGSLTIPADITSIGFYTFAYCSGFSGSLTIPAGVTPIGSSAFYRNGFQRFGHPRPGQPYLHRQLRLLNSRAAAQRLTCTLRRPLRLHRQLRLLSMQRLQRFSHHSRQPYLHRQLRLLSQQLQRFTHLTRRRHLHRQLRLRRMQRFQRLAHFCRRLAINLAGK